MSNRLASQSSPYLLQHADNPVDWFPWDDEAFGKARAENKPIFLSVGYSTCHWCHVMAHESFENANIAAVLNEHFVPIKVDREERPDVDRVYMLFVQSTTGAGGWPMSVWLTPDLEPFYGGTYFPPVTRWGRPGFIDVLEEIARAWRDDPDKLRAHGAQVVSQLIQYASGSSARRHDPSSACRLPPAIDRGDASAMLEQAVNEFAAAFDGVRGGFGGAPKFPRPSELFLLLREWSRLRSGGPHRGSADERGDPGAAALEMVVKTLHAMAGGGIHDHVGGGFHRYSVDARWQVPHFEKMLYDQAQLALAYLEAYQVTGDRRFVEVAGDTLDYVTRDLGRRGGGFFSAEDADSVPAAEAAKPGAHGVEGAFYAWTEEEIDRLTASDSAIVKARFGVRPDGNVESDPQGELAGKNVLFVAKSIEQLAADSGRSVNEVAAALDRARRALFEARSGRPRPGLDDKIIVAWNGLMIAGFARAARVAGHGGDADPRAAGWLATAQRAAAFIESTLWDPDRGRLLRRYRTGEAGIEAYAEDFACLVFGLLELFQADGDPRWLRWALALQKRQDELFWDESGGGWFSTSGADRSVLVRLKEDYDGAEPCASSVAAWNLLTLNRVTGNERMLQLLDETLAAFAPAMSGAPRSVPMMLAALSMWVAPKHEIVIAGPGGREDTEAMLAAVASRYLPSAVVVPLDPGAGAAIAELLPFAAAMGTIEGRAAGYVCRDFACSRPTSSADELLRQLPAAE